MNTALVWLIVVLLAGDLLMLISLIRLTTQVRDLLLISTEDRADRLAREP